MKIYKTRVSPSLERGIYKLPGQITDISKEGIVVATGEDNLIIEQLQIEGKRIMNAKEFTSGHRIKAGEILGNKMT